MDIATSSALDTISVALTAAPKSIPVLSNIYKLTTDIQETTQRVEVNKQQCEQLSERIDTLIGFLAQSDLSNCLNEAIHRALHRLETFLRQCLEFISTFIEASWFKRIVNNRDYEKKFLDLNRELTQYSNDLNFGLGLSNIPKNKKENKNAQADSESIGTGNPNVNLGHQDVIHLSWNASRKVFEGMAYSQDRQLRSPASSTASATLKSPTVARFHRNRRFSIALITQTNFVSIPLPIPLKKISNSGRPRVRLSEEEADEIRFTFHLLLSEKNYPTTQILLN
ncbi:unnamed protein product [Rotaria sp. Silwood2]|nr:unnamed protein product [Rotaria sp. Silwood2]